jgi:hypothetical protein
MGNNNAINATSCPVVTNNVTERTLVVWGGDVGAPRSLDVPRWEINRVKVHIKELEGFKFIVSVGGWRRRREERTSSLTSYGLVKRGRRSLCWYPRRCR